MTVAFSIDPTEDLGTDVTLGLGGLLPIWGLSSGIANLIAAIIRRLTTPRGGLFYDPNYGYDVRAFLNADVSQTDVAQIKAGITAELRKDPRISRVTVDATFTFATKTLQISLAFDTADGPFDLVLAASSVTVDLLSLNGIAAAAPPPANATVVVGPAGAQGQQGLQGPPGTGGGGGSASLDFADARQIASSSGSEDVIFQWDAADFGALAVGSLTAELAGSVFSGSGTATFRLRLGGSDGVADGTVLATITHALASFQAKNATGSFTNPTGLQYVKITAQSSGASVDARMKGPTVTFR